MAMEWQWNGKFRKVPKVSQKWSKRVRSVLVTIRAVWDQPPGTFPGQNEKCPKYLENTDGT